MAEDSAQEKTEEPTEKKREDARNDGQVAMSREVMYLFTYAATLMVFYFGGEFIFDKLKELVAISLRDFTIFPGDDPLPSINAFMGEIFFRGILVGIPFVLMVAVTGIAASIAQIGFKISWKPIEPNLNKISPLQGLKRIFGIKALGDLIKIILKIIFLGYIGYITVSSNLIPILNLSALEGDYRYEDIFQMIWELFYRFFIAFIVIALIDYGFQKWDFEKKIKMTKQEIKDEMKQTEGDPHIKGKIREAQKKLSRARMLQDIPESDVVITNPTHFAIVLKYDNETMQSPTVMAKGADFLALRIIEIAKNNDVTVVRNPPVARAMYDKVEIGEEVPEDFYKIVAEILSFVYKQKNKTINN